MTRLLIDRAQLVQNRARMRDDALFLHKAAVDEIKDRLEEVNRTFTKPAVVTGFRPFWSEAFPAAKVVDDRDVLDLQPQAHDLVIHGLALHWSNDPVGQLIQCRRALAPDGLFLGVLFGGQTLFQLRAVLAEAEIAETGGLSPRVAPMGEIRDLGGLMQRAGFALPVADSVSITASYADIWSLMRDLRAMGEANALEQRLKQPTRRAVFDRADALLKSGSAEQDGRMTETFELIYLTGWAPDENQQKPMRPGSALTRLADALGTEETKLSD